MPLPYKTMLVVAALVCVNSFAASTSSGDCVININESEGNLSLGDSCVVNLNDGGSVGFLDLSEQAQANLFGGSSVNFLSLFENSHANLFENTEVSFMSVFDQASASVYDDATLFVTDVNDQAHVDFFGGEMTALELFDQSSANLYQVDLLSIIISPDAEVTLFGTEFSYFEGLLSGVWGDGSSFSIETFVDGVPTGDTLPSNFILAPVPVPSALVLFGSGLVVLVRLKRRTD
ncbi:MAG: hypothetical protein AB8G18_02715 [Gammaproteobacteria bacterium]